MFDSLGFKVGEIDEVLDSLSDAGAAGKRKIGNDLVAEFEDGWSVVASKLIEQMQGMEEDQRVGSFLGLVRALSGEFEESSKNYIAKIVESQPKAEVPTVSDDEKKELSANRTLLFTQMKHVRELALAFNEAEAVLDENGNVVSVPGWELPAVRRGGFGPRGKRALSFYTWAIDGTGVDEDSDSVKGVAGLLGFEKVADFSKALRDGGVDTRSPEAEFSVEVRGKTVTATRVDEVDDENGDEEVDETSE
jgi:hypothetical protein